MTEFLVVFTFTPWATFNNSLVAMGFKTTKHDHNESKMTKGTYWKQVAND